MYGWQGTILRVDLSEARVTKEPLKLDFARKWVGGEGFGAKILWDEVGPEVKDALEPDNVLIFATGPLTSTLAPGSGRLELVSKHAMSGIFGDSNSGGHFAPELKQAGYDMLIVTGKAKRPVYLWIDDDKVEIRDASHLWGKTISETDELIKAELGDKDVQVSCIGPGGENLVRFAILVNNLVRAPGRTGCGAVAGSKNLKAVVVRGTKGVRIARPEAFEEVCFNARQKVEKLRVLPTVRQMGTMILMRRYYAGGTAMLHNFETSQCPESYLEQVDGERWAEEFLEKSLGCHGCPMQCSHYARIKEGPYAGLAGEGYEFGNMMTYLYWYGPSNLAFAMKASQYCNDNGLDGSEPGMVLAWATDCFKQGILTETDTDGLVLDWGDEEVGLELMRKMTYREGFGDLLAEGLWKASNKLGRGSEYYADTIKGVSLMEVTCRTAYGYLLAAATSTRGSDHLKGHSVFETANLPPELSEKRWGSRNAGNRLSYEDKAPMITYVNHICTLVDMLGTCKFHSVWFNLLLQGLDEKDYAIMLSTATGIDFSSQELLELAEKVWNLEQAYNVRVGLGRNDDTLPRRYFEEPLNSGPYKGHIVDKKKFEQMLDEYYRFRGWDVETGIPTRQTLERLDLKDVAAELEGRGCCTRK
ncbi:aldehyde ferredoxin oxidoreductase family protein [Chloroflexota bacterium]